MYVSFRSAAARALARSPSGCASVCTPIGAKRTGARHAGPENGRGQVAGGALAGLPPFDPPLPERLRVRARGLAIAGAGQDVCQRLGLEHLGGPVLQLREILGDLPPTRRVDQLPVLAKLLGRSSVPALMRTTYLGWRRWAGSARRYRTPRQSDIGAGVESAAAADRTPARSPRSREERNRLCWGNCGATRHPGTATSRSIRGGR